MSIMVELCIIHILLIIICLESEAARPKCGHSEMMKDNPSEDSFERKFHKTYRSVNSSGVLCAQLCHDDERCNGISVCPDVCHLFGVFPVTPSSVPGTYDNTCDVYNMNRCENGGTPDESGYCRCNRGYGGPFCQTLVQDYCYNEWRLTYNSDTSQSLDEHLVALNTSCRMQTKAVIEDKIVHSMDVTKHSGSKTWSQSTSYLSKSSWNAFDVSPSRIFTVIKNAKYQTIMKVDISGSSGSLASSTIVVKWYIKDISYGPPTFENDKNGAVLAGDINSLISKIETGSAVTTFFNLFVDKDTQTVAGDCLKELGINLRSSFPKYNSPAYWYLYKMTTAGKRHVLRWKVGVGSIATPSTDTVITSWCTDDCWVRAFTSDQFGNGLHGSTSDLARALLSGHQVRVYTGGVAASTRAVYIHGQTISACLEEMMEPISVADFDRSGMAVNMIVSSNGQIQTRSYTLDTDSILGESQEYQPIDWFVDTREWTKVLSLSGDGQILTGSITDLRQKVLVGASVRIVVDLSTGHSVVVDADHLEVAPSGHVAADVIYHVNVNFTMSYFAFAATSSAHLWSAIITTEGAYNTYYYTYKRDDGQRAPVSIVDRYIWFVQM